MVHLVLLQRVSALPAEAALPLQDRPAVDAARPPLRQEGLEEPGGEGALGLAVVDEGHSFGEGLCDGAEELSGRRHRLDPDLAHPNRGDDTRSPVPDSEVQLRLPEVVEDLADAIRAEGTRCGNPHIEFRSENLHFGPRLHLAVGNPLVVDARRELELWDGGHRGHLDALGSVRVSVEEGVVAPDREHDHLAVLWSFGREVPDAAVVVDDPDLPAEPLAQGDDHLRGHAHLPPARGRIRLGLRQGPLLLEVLPLLLAELGLLGVGDLAPDEGEAEPRKEALVATVFLHDPVEVRPPEAGVPREVAALDLAP